MSQFHWFQDLTTKQIYFLQRGIQQRGILLMATHINNIIKLTSKMRFADFQRALVHSVLDRLVLQMKANFLVCMPTHFCDIIAHSIGVMSV